MRGLVRRGSLRETGRRVVVARRLASITLDNLADLPSRCRGCVYWELDPIAGERAVQAGGTELEKEAWVSDCLLEWGSCGQIAYVDGVAAGYVLYAPPAYVPRSVAFPTSPSSPDAVLLMTAWLAPEFRGAGLGRMLVQTAVRDVTAAGSARSRRSDGTGRAARRRGARAGLPGAGGLPARGGVQDGAPAPAHSAAAAGREEHRDLEGGRRIRAGTAARPRSRCPAPGRWPAEPAQRASWRGCRRTPVGGSSAVGRYSRCTATSRPSATVSRNSGSASRGRSTGEVR